jgi:hypothetical protein
MAVPSRTLEMILPVIQILFCKSHMEDYTTSFDIVGVVWLHRTLSVDEQVS